MSDLTADTERRKRGKFVIPLSPVVLFIYKIKERFVWRRGRPLVPAWDFC